MKVSNIRLGMVDKRGNEIVKITRYCFYAKVSRKELKGIDCSVMNGRWSIDEEGNWLLRFGLEDAKLFS